MIVYIIGAAVAVYIVWKVMRLVTRRNDPCAYCSGCDLRKELIERSKAAGRPVGNDKVKQRQFREKRETCRTDPSQKPSGGTGCGCGCG